MTRLLVLTGTTGYPLLERHVQDLADQHGDLEMILQSPNVQAERDNLKYSQFLDLDTLDGSKLSAVIGHCGAGTVFWTLERGLPLIAIVDLMRPDDHQEDLGNWVRQKNYGLVLMNRGPTYEEILKLTAASFATYRAEPFSIKGIEKFLH